MRRQFDKNRAFALVAGVSLAIASFGAIAQAQEKGWYLGGSVGRSDVDLQPITVVGATAFSSSTNERDTGYKLIGGYRFNRHFALEGGWSDFGKFSTTTNVTAPVIGSAGASVRVDGWHLDAVGILPVRGGFSLHGKLGAMYSSTRTSLSTTGAVALAAGTNLNPKRRETNLKWGVGAGYDFSRNVGLRLEYDQVKDVGNADTGEGDVGMWTLGVVFRF